jgi:Family of unknown function (DUF5995)
MAYVPLPEGICDVAVPPQTPTAADVLARLKMIQGLFHADPLAYVDDSSARLADLDSALADLRKGQDGVACFNYLYMVITADIKKKIEEGGFFRDNDFINKFDAFFGDRYISALQKYAGCSTSGPAPA